MKLGQRPTFLVVVLVTEGNLLEGLLFLLLLLLFSHIFSYPAKSGQRPTLVVVVPPVLLDHRRRSLRESVVVDVVQSSF